MNVSPAAVAPRIAIVVTTINEGSFIDNLIPLLRKLGNRLSVFVIGDQKTRPECGPKLAQAASEGHDIVWMDTEEQRRWLSQLPWLASHIPWNSDNRRNIGILEAWRRGHDVIALLDDDNEVIDIDEFAACYSRTGSNLRGRQILSKNRWINVCELLDCRSGYNGEPVLVFPRGHPHVRRGYDRLELSKEETDGAIALHLGLWLGDPDVDAATRAAVAPIAVSAKVDSPVFMPEGALSGLSSQNIAVARRVVPAWWFVRMGAVSPSLVMDRFGDMLQGYFASMAVAAMGERIAVGPPFVRHRRNPHSLVRDLALELPGMSLLEALLPLLESPSIPAQSYADSYLRTADRLTDWARSAAPVLWGDAVIAWADTTAASMAAWVRACKELDPSA